MNKPFFLQVAFSKEKLGIRVEERVIESKEKEKASIDHAKSTQVKLLENGTTITDEEKPEDSGTGEQNVETEIENAGIKSIAEIAEVKSSEEDEGQPCELVVKAITDKDLYAFGLIENSVITAINNIHMRGLPYKNQVGFITSTKKPFTLTFTGPKYLRKKIVQKVVYPKILKELVREEDNAVKSAFYELVKGTRFEKDLCTSEDKVTTIAELLSNQGRLTAMLQNVAMQEVEL